MSYEIGQLGYGSTQDSGTNVLLGDQRFMEYMGNNNVDVNAMSSDQLQSMYGAYQSQGTTAMANSPVGLGTPTFNTDSMGMLAQPKYTEYMSDRGMDINSMSDDNLAKVKLDVDGPQSDLGFNTQTLGAAAGLGQLALGVASYADQHKMNKQTLKEKRFNLDQAKSDASATDYYRRKNGVMV